MCERLSFAGLLRLAPLGSVLLRYTHELVGWPRRFRARRPTEPHFLAPAAFGEPRPSALLFGTPRTVADMPAVVLHAAPVVNSCQDEVSGAAPWYTVTLLDTVVTTSLCELFGELLHTHAHGPTRFIRVWHGHSLIR